MTGGKASAHVHARTSGAMDAVRWLVAPHTVLALVVLALNDHVWKQQYPGAITGKVSDVAGLVVAPPLLAVVLAVLGKDFGPRPRGMQWISIGIVGLGFGLVKATESGALVASDVWSLAVPSHIRADPTDLLALPALLVAAAAQRWSLRSTRKDRRRTATLALAALILPAAVLATAATSPCRPYEGVSGVVPVSGGLETSAHGWITDFVFSGDGGVAVLQKGELVLPTVIDQRRIGAYRRADPDADRREKATQLCSTVQPRECWRLPQRDRVLVEQSTDGGSTWAFDYGMSKVQRRRLVDDLGQKCGKSAQVFPGDFAIAETELGPVVALTLNQGGVVVRHPTTGGWRRIEVQPRFGRYVVTGTATVPAPGSVTAGPERPRPTASVTAADPPQEDLAPLTPLYQTPLPPRAGSSLPPECRPPSPGGPVGVGCPRAPGFPTGPDGSSSGGP